MVRLEKNKYMRERLAFKGAGQMTLFDRANAKYHKCQDEVTDNLCKQAKTILKPKEEDFKKYFGEFNLEDADGKAIEDKITSLQAAEFKAAWEDIQRNFLQQMTNIRNKASTERDKEEQDLINYTPDELLTYQKDKLFIESGEDVEDIFLAFRHYKLN